MGFFSGLAGGILGGGKTTGSGSTVSGFQTLPQEIQAPFIDFANQAGAVFKGGAANNLFRPMAQTSEETKALELVAKGLAPTSDSLRSDIAMFMNPFDDYVINDINRESQGANSLVKQAGSMAGQMGSNRNFLQTSDIERTRLNDIGRFRQDQYNTAVERALGQLAGLRQQDIDNLYGAGTFRRNLDTAERQAPIAALQSYGSLLGALPKDGGATSSNWEGKKGNALTAIGNIGRIAGTIGGLF